MIVNSSAGRRTLLLLAAALVVWAFIVLLTGGVVLEFEWGRLSSRAAIRPLIGAGLVFLFYAVHLRQHWRTDLGPLRYVSLPHAVLTTAILVTLAVGLGWGTRIAGGPDASGYVSEAAMFARGQLRTPTPVWVDGATWNNAALTASPVGYRPSQQTILLAPVYSPGLPLIMAGFQLAAGPGAVFYVVPVLGVIAIWATWLLGKELGGVWTGAIAATLMTTSPAFLMMLVQPVSDVPGTAFWTLSLVAACRGQGMAVAGAATAAILVRPNIVPLAAVPLLLLLLAHGGFRVRTAFAFAATVLPAPAAIAFLNWYFYGSPLYSGYGSLSDLYGVERLWPNAEQYRSWFFNSQTALPLLGLLAPAFAKPGVERLRVLLVTTVFPIALVALYLPYQLAFKPEEWSYLRFLLPGYPALMTGFAMVVLAICRRVPNPLAATLLAVIVVGGVGVHAWTWGQDNSLFHFKEADQRYVRAVAHAHTLSQKAVLFSLAHSGTLHFYTGRDVVRFEAVPRDDIDTIVAHLEARGHPLYLIGDPFEIDMFRELFAGTKAVKRLDRAPSRDLGGAIVYSLSDLN